MKTTLAIAALLATSAFACAAPTDEPSESEVPTVDTSSTTDPQMIKQGSCSPAELAMGAWEAGGVCFSGGGAGGGGGGAGAGACMDKCSTRFGRCEASCEARGATNACLQLCFRQESICYQGCR